jgi:hypothetical protein
MKFIGCMHEYPDSVPVECDALAAPPNHGQTSLHFCQGFAPRDVALAEGNELVEALGLDESTRRSANAFRLGFEPELEAFDTYSARNRVERVGEQGVAVVSR